MTTAQITSKTTAETVLVALWDTEAPLTVTTTDGTVTRGQIIDIDVLGHSTATLDDGDVNMADIATIASDDLHTTGSAYFVLADMPHMQARNTLMGKVADAADATHLTGAVIAHGEDAIHVIRGEREVIVRNWQIADRAALTDALAPLH